MTRKSGVMSFEFDIQFFGGGSRTSAQTYRKRDPEDPQLTDLRNGLYQAFLPNLQNYDPSKWGEAQKIADGALASQGELLSKVGGVTDQNQGIVDKMLETIQTGNVPQNLTDNMQASVNRGLQSGMGNMLNSLGNRGVLNSSITGSGISNLSQKAANAMQDGSLNIFNSVLGGYQGALQGGQGNAQSLLGAAQGYGSLGNQAFQNAGAQLMPAYNFWRDVQNSYDNREDFDTVVSQKSGK